MRYTQLIISFYFKALNDPSIDSSFQRLNRMLPRHPNDPEKVPKVYTKIE